MARQKTDQTHLLRILVWAVAVFVAQPLRSKRAQRAFPNSKSNMDSTLFYKILHEGHPWPKFFSNGQLDGPALQIENEYPGTLAWLIHPIWNILRLPPLSSLRQIYSLMATCRDSIFTSLVSIEDGVVARRMDPLEQQLMQISIEGCLDGLMCFVLLALEAFHLCEPVRFNTVFQFANDRVPHWKCLGWMPPALRSAVIDLVLIKIKQCEPAPIYRDEALLHRFQEIVIDAPDDGRPSGPLDDAKIVTPLLDALTATGSIAYPSGRTKSLPDKTTRTIKTVIRPWLDEGAP